MWQKLNNSEKTKAFFDVLYSMDQKISIIVKYVGYIGIILIPVAFYVFAKFGLDLKSYFYGRELTQAQQEIISSLKARGYEISQDGALNALEERSPALIDYLKSDILPETDRARELLRRIVYSGKILEGDIDILKGWFRRDSAAFSDVLPLLNDANKFVSSIATEVPFANGEEVCSALGANVQGGAFGYTLRNNSNCVASFTTGAAGTYLIQLIKTSRYWNDVTGIVQPAQVPSENIAKIVSLPGSATLVSERPITPITPQLFDMAVDGDVHRFVVDVREYSSLASIEQEGGLRLAVRNQEPGIEKSVFRIRLLTHFTKDWFYQFCGQGETCKIDFDGVFFDKKLYLLKILGAEKGDPELWAYIDYDPYWNDSK